MVYLSRIYTKSGDQGETGLGDGSRVPKDHPRVAAYGAVDELNATLGLMAAEGLTGETAAAITGLLRHIQNDLFDVGADLCVPAAGEAAESRLRVKPEQVAQLERWIDKFNEELQPLTSFVLPGGTPGAAWCHLARTVCRRAEREIVQLGRQEQLNPQVVIYMNRLSDLLFVLARILNNKGRDDVLWVPGKSAASNHVSDG
jgi:cob(I)alamin adenosyltransferase